MARCDVYPVVISIGSLSCKQGERAFVWGCQNKWQALQCCGFGLK